MVAKYMIDGYARIGRRGAENLSTQILSFILLLIYFGTGQYVLLLTEVATKTYIALSCNNHTATFNYCNADMSKRCRLNF